MSSIREFTFRCTVSFTGEWYTVPLEGAWGHSWCHLPVETNQSIRFSGSMICRLYSGTFKQKDTRRARFSSWRFSMYSNYRGWWHNDSQNGLNLLYKMLCGDIDLSKESYIIFILSVCSDCYICTGGVQIQHVYISYNMYGHVHIHSHVINGYPFTVVTAHNITSY